MINSYPWRVSVIRAMQFAAALAILLSPRGGWTQSADQPTFTPLISQKVDARAGLAKVTTETDSALISKGYIRIGTISDSQPYKGKNSEITRQLESAILQRAAAAGGDPC